MSKLLIVAMPGNESMARALAARLDAEVADLELRQFPDEETYLRFLTDLQGRSLVVVSSLARPNDKILPLLFASATARDLSVAKVGLVSPYLAYMRQDRRFKPGEAVTSREVARLLSDSFDWLVTVDPHLHRYRSLNEIYSIPTRVVHAAPLISRWVGEHVPDPLIIGPDSESEQWVSAVAKDVNAPFTLLEKVRLGDRRVQISLRDLSSLNGRTPVLVDDIISSGRTMVEAVRLIKERSEAVPVCIAAHGLFADKSDTLLSEMGARVITSNSIPHATNGMDVSELVSSSITSLLAQGS
jgi:ribose-phosphate pyrophosphokinase